MYLHCSLLPILDVISESLCCVASVQDIQKGLVVNNMSVYARKGKKKYILISIVIFNSNYCTAVEIQTATSDDMAK